MTRKILVTGASVAGLTLAWWLSRAGHDVTVVESAPAFRDGGQNVDVREAARTVLRRMGLERAVADLNTGERGLAFEDEDGKVVAEFDVEAGSDGPTAELEILRGDLARLLHERCRERVTFRFGDRIAAVDDGPDAVAVTFRSGLSERYDLVVVAEGVGSSTRELVFAGENEPRWLDVQMGYFTIPRGPGDGAMARWFNAPGGRSVLLRPDRQGTTRAVLTLQAPSQGEDELTADQQKSLLQGRFADAGWETPRVLAGLAATDDFYFDVLRQVQMPRWSHGRVALTGDAAWCVTPLGGIGTSLAIVGAYVLAGELSRTDDHRAALASYERLMRPYVEQGQDVPKIGPRMAEPRTRLGIALQRAVLGVAAAPGIRSLTTRLLSPPADAIDLPDYGDAAPPSITPARPAGP